eukprot:Clim_evm2s93 gene=Clim_evmTU2s93
MMPMTRLVKQMAILGILGLCVHLLLAHTWSLSETFEDRIGELQLNTRKSQMQPSCEKDTIAALCIHSAWGNSLKRSVFRRLWLGHEVETDKKISYMFIVGTDNMMSPAEIQELEDERLHFGDIVIADRVEESFNTLAKKTKYCVDFFVGETDEFDFFVKTDDDTIILMDRLIDLMSQRLCKIPKVYFGFPHEPAPVANPNRNKSVRVNTAKYFEWRYPDEEWPLWMQGGLYGFSYDLAKEVTEMENFEQYISEDTTTAVWMHQLGANIFGLDTESVIYRPDAEYKIQSSSSVVSLFQSNPIHMVAVAEGPQMKSDTEDPRNEIADSANTSEVGFLRSISFVRSGYVETDKQFNGWPRHFTARIVERLQQLAASAGSSVASLYVPVKDRIGVEVYLDRLWEINQDVDWDHQWDWWRNMHNSYRFQIGNALLGGSNMDMYPLHHLEHLKWLAIDDYHLQTAKTRNMKPTFYVISPTATREDIETWAPTATRNSLFSFLPCYASDDQETPVYSYIKRREHVFWMCHRDEQNKLTQSLFNAYERHDIRIFSIELLKWIGFNEVMIWGRPMAGQANDEFSRLIKKKRRGLRLGQIVLRKRSFIMPRGVFKDISLVAEVDLLMKSMPLSLWQLLVPKQYGRLSSGIGFFSALPEVRTGQNWDETADAQVAGQVLSIAHYRNWMSTHIPYGPISRYYIWVSRTFELMSEKRLDVAL